MVKEHVCVLPTGCECSISALEPNEKCPVHGVPDNRCAICGKFMKIWTKLEEEPHK